AGYEYAEAQEYGETAQVRTGSAGRLHILEVQRLMRTMGKVVIAMVGGWAAGGGHSLHVVSDLSIASREHARFMQTDADVGSFDGGYGSAYLARQVGQKRARELAARIATDSLQAIWMLKFAFNLADDGLMGQQVFAGEAPRLAYMTDGAAEGRDAFLEKRAPDWSRFPHPQG